MASPSRLIVLAAIVGIALVVASARGEAHKPITSPFTYSNEVFPILRDRCGRCHAPGGIAPMSLMTYKDAFPWGESIRTELIAGHMPPWNADQAAAKFRSPNTLSARELNILLTWVTGGNPMGDPERTPPEVSLRRDWPLGPPDLVVPMPAEVTIAADKTEETREFNLQVAMTGARLLRAIDLLPGTSAIVRSATISVKAADVTSNPAAAAAERIVALWVPGDTPVAFDGGPAFSLPANAELILRVHYKKTWENERLAMTDRSSVGLYFAPPTARELRALVLSPEPGRTAPPDVGRTLLGPASRDQISFTRTITEDLEAVALYPDSALANVTVEVTLERPDGTRAELIRFRPRADWARRYWFAEPVSLPRGTRVTVVGTFNDVLLPPGAAPIAAKPEASALRLTLNVF